MAVSVQFSVLVNGLEMSFQLIGELHPTIHFKHKSRKEKQRYQKSLAVMGWFSCGLCDKDFAVFQIFVCIFMQT